MHAEILLHRWLSNVLPGIHPKRLKALSAVVSGAICGGKLTVTGLGRSIRSEAKEKHSIKRADRLLSNENLQSERFSIYASVAQRIIGKAKTPVILVDWSDMDGRREFFLLRAATPVKGRSLTLYEEVHDRSTKEKRSTHNVFLERLKDVLPKGCKPIIITDAGFRGPWFQKVRALGWDFVGRVRNRDMAKIAENKPWIRAKSLYSRATTKPTLLSEAVLARSNPLCCSFVLYKSKPKGRVSLGKMGKKKHNNTSLVNSARAKEPWLLATSLPATARRIVRLYSTRMQIEESFRDLKCSRFGLSLYQNGTYKIERLKILVLIGSLTATFAWLLGKVAQSNGNHRQFQANSIKHLSVLSTVFIGIRIFRKNSLRISTSSFQYAQKQLSKLVLQMTYDC